MNDYDETIEDLTMRLAELLSVKNKKNGFISGYIGLMIRDLSCGNIDIIHNCDNRNDIINILQLAIVQLKGH